MCGRFTLRKEFPEVEESVGSVLTWNQAPGTRIVTVRREEAGHRVERMRWGYTEIWMKEARHRLHPPYINATMETALRSGSWSSDALMRRRCIVPADGWYEWPRIGSRKNDRARPHFIHFKDDRLFGFGGIWTDDPGRPNSEFSLAILTTQPNTLLQSLPHERMPVIIPRAQWAAWLAPDTSGRRITSMMEPWRDLDLEMWQVAPAVNGPRHNAPDCITPV